MNTRQQQIEDIKRYRQYEWDFYLQMLSQCYDKRFYKFSKFGAHGYSVHTEWRLNKDRGFIQFLQDIGKRPSSKHTLELLGMAKEFSPSTLKWIQTKHFDSSSAIDSFVDNKTKWSGLTTSRDERFFI